MISFGLPWALAAGGALAVAAVVLHLLAPRPPGRAPLPTARFLREEARTFVRPRRVPSDVPVLALRVALALLLGALFAQPRWVPDRTEGTTRVVLLDRGAGMADVWDRAVSVAVSEAEAADGDALVVPFDTAVGEPVEVRPGDGAAAETAVPDVPAAAESSYLVALRALRRAALRDARTTEVEAVLVSRPRWGAWDRQLGALRARAWPGPIRLVDPAAASDGEASSAAGRSGGEAPSGSARSDGGAPSLFGRSEGGATSRVGPSEADPSSPAARSASVQPPRPRAVVSEPSPHVAAALEVLGYEVAAAGSDGTSGLLRFIASEPPDLGAALEAAARGDTVVVFGPEPDTLGLWDPRGWPASPRPPRTLRVGAAVLDIESEAARRAGAPAAGPGRRLAIAWDDGAPAAAALEVGSGCIVRFGGSLDAGAGDPDYPVLLRALADACRDGRETPDPAGASPLDAAARASLAGEGPAAVRVASLGERGGRALEPWVLLLAVAVAIAETATVERVLRRRSVPAGYEREP